MIRQNKYNKRILEKTQGIILPISNCHSETLTTTIQIGTDSTQKFDVVLDTTSIHTWIPSSKCETCEFFNTYDYDDSSNVYKVVAPTLEINKGVELSGDEVSSTISLGGVVVPNVRFGAISDFPEEYYPLCGSVDGILGLGKGEDNLLQNLVMGLDVPVVSFFLNADADDYMIEVQNRKLSRPDDGLDDGPLDDTDGELDENDVEFADDLVPGNEGEDDDKYDDDEYGIMINNPEVDNEAQDVSETPNDKYDDDEGPPPNNADEEYVDDDGIQDDVYDVGDGEQYTPRPKHARSELILGGVDPKRYNGCLIWHTAVNNENTWSIEFDLGDGQANIATLSTITDGIHGPSSFVGEYLQANNAQCYDLVVNKQDDAYIEEQDVALQELGPTKDCAKETFDVAFYDCTTDQTGNAFKPFEFQTKFGNNEVMRHTLAFHELIEQYLNENDELVCAFRIKSLPQDANQGNWIFGTPLFEKFYIAFHVQENSVGIAPIRYDYDIDGDDEFCQADAGLFVSKTFKDATTATSFGNEQATQGTMQQASNNEGSSIIASLEETASNNTAVVVIPILIVLAFIVGLVVKRRRRRNDTVDATTRSTPGINYDFVDPSCRSGGLHYDDGEWEGYDDRHTIS